MAQRTERRRRITEKLDNSRRQLVDTQKHLESLQTKYQQDRYV